MILNGHEYVACRARKAGLRFTKEGNCFTTISDAAGLAKIADTLSEPRAIGRLSQICERWIYSCLCFALDFDEQKRSGFRYQYSSYQIEYSRNLVFEVGGHLDQVFQALIDRSRAPLDLKSIRTILGYRRRPRYRPRAKRSAEWEVSVEKPAYDLTIFKLHCGKLTLKIYSKGERVLRIEAVAHNTQQFSCGRALDKFPEVVARLKGVLERFADALSCIDQCFIADDMLEQLPTASQVGKTIVGGIDLNKTRMRAVVEAVIALSASPNGFTASDTPPGCVSAAHHTVPATPPTISKSSAASTSFAASATPAATHRSPAGSARSPRWSFSATKLSNLSSPPPGPSTQPAAGSTPNPSTPTTTPSGSPCRASFMNWASLLDDRQFFCRASPRSA